MSSINKFIYHIYNDPAGESDSSTISSFQEDTFLLARFLWHIVFANLIFYN